MPTATITKYVTSSPTAAIPLKSAAPMSKPSSSTAATLRSLYPRAATAFLQRDIVLTHSLLSAAFALLSPPLSEESDDSLAIHRRKWDLLRITFETTSYSSPPSSEDPDAFPSSLRANQMLSPPSFLGELHNRSLQLFTPSSPTRKPSSAFLPAQILVVLGLASLKLGCPEVGRGIIEDWLARRGQDSVPDDLEGYAKILHLYCLQVLPRLEEWDYAADFLLYERELSKHDVEWESGPPYSFCRGFAHEEICRLLMGDLTTKGHMSSSLQALHAQKLASRIIPSPVITPLDTIMSAESSRTVSPAPSLSSESSNSTHTATPTSPRLASAKAKGKMKGDMPSMTHVHSSPATSSSSQSISSIATSDTATPANTHGILPRRTADKEKPVSKTPPSFAKSRMKSASPLPRAPRSLSLDPPSSAVTRSPNIFTIIRSFVDTSLHNLTKSRTVTLVLLFVVFPVLSLLFRLRRRRSGGASSGGVGVADSVRRRLQVGTLEKKGVLSSIWEELVRSMIDTVKMGGRGLV